MDKPDGSTVWLGALAVPCEAVNDWPDKPTTISAGVITPTDEVIALEDKP